MLMSRSGRRDIVILAIVHLALCVLLFRPWPGEGCDGVHYYTYLSSFLFDGDIEYQLTTQSADEHWEANQPVFDAMVASFTAGTR